MGEKITIFTILTAVTILVPYIFTMLMNGNKSDYTDELSGIETGRDVLIMEGGQNKLIDVEEYIEGILPGIVSFESSEAVIEAQAVAVRTKIYYLMGEDTVIKLDKLPYKYISPEKYREQLGESNYKRVMAIYRKAIINTAGKTAKSE